MFPFFFQFPPLPIRENATSLAKYITWVGYATADGHGAEAALRPLAGFSLCAVNSISSSLSNEVTVN